jgi:branched-chain amino acid aminotransferase
LEQSAALMGQPGTLAREVAHASIRAALRAAGHPLSRVRLTFAAPQLYVTVEPFVPYTDAVRAAGVRCVTVPLRRENPHAKSTAFNVQAAAAYKQLPGGVEEGLMVDEAGDLLEGLSSNFFAVVNGELRYEADRVLIGTTSQLVLEAARAALPQLHIQPAPVRLADMPGAEAFITSVSREVLPVRQINDLDLGPPGPVTRALIAAVQALVAREAASVGSSQ